MNSIFKLNYPMLMKQYVLGCVLMLATFTLSWGQVEEPTITPVTPEASSLGRYGGTDIMSATGQMSYSVPIHNISVDGNSWPVTLNYSYGGLILEGKPSLSGLGWNLSSYGSITKEVRGLPDGHPDGYYGINNRKASIDLAAADYADNNLFDTTDIYTIRKFKNGEWDSEVDKYTVTVNGMNFSFKLRKDGTTVVPYYLSNHNYKVTVNMDQFEHFVVGSFVVTDDHGVKYYFDDDNREHVVSDDTQSQAMLADQYTSWMLSKVVYLNGQEIDFQYTTDSYISWGFVATALSLYGDPDEGNITGSGEIQYQTFDSDRVTKSTMSRQILNKITFPSGSVDLTTTTINSSREVFDTIILKDYNDTVINTYDFTYQGNRDLLTTIQKNGEFLYEFEYYDTSGGISIPAFYEDPNITGKPYAQDFWKFYNGKTSNNSAFALGSSNYTADRTANTLYGRLGAMKRMKYKTGGFSEVWYEGNQVKKPIQALLEEISYH